LSRFDLLFILLDSVDEEGDRKISDHVLRVHRYRDPREADGTATSVFSGADDLVSKGLLTELFKQFLLNCFTDDIQARQ